MKVDNELMIGLEDIIKKYKNSKIAIFGAGNDGLRLYKSTYGELDIDCFIDNGNTDGLSFLGKKLYNFKDYRLNCSSDIIIVASLRYYKEIVQQMVDLGLKKEIDFVVWNGDFSSQISFVAYDDKNIRDYIEYNNTIWNNPNKNNGNMILIPYRETLEIVHPVWGYSAHYLSEKYNSDIFCIGGVRDVYSSDYYKIYESLGVNGFIDETPNLIQKKEIELLFSNIWSKIKTVKDIKNIEIYGENYGTDFVRDYLRIYFPKYIEKDYTLKKQLKEMIGYIVFWRHFFEKKHENIKSVIVWDGVFYREGIIRKIAYGYNIPVYSVLNESISKWDYEQSFSFKFYKKFFNMLSEDEKKNGMAFSEKKLNSHINGYLEPFGPLHRSVFSEKEMNNNIIEENNLIKVMICPHYSEDDAFPYGDDMLFDTPWEWLEYLGKLSNVLPYDWYLKPHPIEKKLGDKLIEEYIKKYPKIKLLPKFVSPIQLKNKGMNFALTIHGSIGYEYPYIGIDVINAGFNPHIAFDFCDNPKTLDEYNDILYNLEKYHKRIDSNEILQFFSIHFGYYKGRIIDIKSVLFKDDRLKDVRGLVGSKTNCSTELFKIYIQETSDKKHRENIEFFSKVFDYIDTFKDGVFYKKNLI